MLVRWLVFIHVLSAITHGTEATRAALTVPGAVIVISGFGALLSPIGYGWAGIHLWRMASLEEK